MREKRRILDFVFSNCSWKDGRLSPTHKKPFDMLALTNAAYEKTKAASLRRPSQNWLPFVNEFRTACTIPSPEMKVVFKEFGEVGFPY